MTADTAPPAPPAPAAAPAPGSRLVRIDLALLAAYDGRPEPGRHRIERVTTSVIDPERRAAVIAAVEAAAAQPAPTTTRVIPPTVVGVAPVPAPQPPAQRARKLAMMLRNLPHRWQR